MRITSCGITDVGLKRSHNEDNFLINEELNLYVVADGMGGHNGGEYASAICVNTVEEIVENMELGDDAVPVEEDDPVDLVREKLRYALRLSGRRIYEKAAESLGVSRHGHHRRRPAAWTPATHSWRTWATPACTWSAMTPCEQVTEDHSFVARQVKAGVLTRRKRPSSHRMRNVIYRSLGYQEDVEVDVQVRGPAQGRPLPAVQRWAVRAPRAVRDLRPPGAATTPRKRRLAASIDLACERGGDDNITVVVTALGETR